MEKNFYTYILTNWTGKVMYVGVTNDLQRRMAEHKAKMIKGFTSKYGVDRLVYFEAGQSAEGAIQREKQIKGWLREKKNMLVETMNPEWRDLSDDIV
jgi:putative endonuclease